jgi:hypothetical protein
MFSGILYFFELSLNVKSKDGKIIREDLKKKNTQMIVTTLLQSNHQKYNSFLWNVSSVANILVVSAFKFCILNVFRDICIINS